MDGINDSMGMNLSKLRETVKDRESWRAAVHGVEKSWTRLSELQQIVKCPLGDAGKTSSHLQWEPVMQFKIIKGC